MSSDTNKYRKIRQLVRGCYDLQEQRITTGLRLVAAFKGTDTAQKLDEEGEKEAKALLDSMKKSYSRITDAVAAELLAKGSKRFDPTAISSSIPTRSKFKPDGLISDYIDLVAVKAYFDQLRLEEDQFHNLETVLKDFPIYTEFLEKIDGMGPKMAGVILSEFDITKARYPSSMEKYAGIDTVMIGYYKNDNGDEKIVSGEDVEKFYEENSVDVQMLAEGKYPVYFKQVGRSRRSFCLVSREYTTKEGGQAFKQSLSHNIWLKTKLIGVLGPSFLKQTRVLVNGAVMSSVKRVEFARSIGFKQDSKSEDSLSKQADEFLKNHGHELQFTASKYGQIYYDYRFRLNNSRHHDSKTQLHKHNMAVRYMIKFFIRDLYAAWREIEGLTVYKTYEEEKLGIDHRVSKPGVNILHPLLVKFAYEPRD